MSKVVRSVKNVTKGYSTVEVKVRNATSNDPWGPAGSEMAEIAQMTFNSSTDFYQIMDMLDKRLNDKGRNWRHVLKSLKVLDYCLHEGSELVVTWARKNIYIIKTLREFQHIEEDGRDVGQNVRISAKELTSLLLDEDRLRSERTDRKSWKVRVTGIEEFGIQGGSEPARIRRRENRSQRSDEEDLEYRLAIEASKNEAEEDRRRRERNVGRSEDDDDLAKAIKLSKEEEEHRRNEQMESNASSLFSDNPAPTSMPQPTGSNQGYQQQGAVDWFGNLVDPQQQQSTGFLNNAYSHPSVMQGQQTGFQNGLGYGQYLTPQPTPLDHSLQAKPFIQPQQTAFNVHNPYGQQQQLLEPQFTLQPGTNNPWADVQPQVTDSLKARATGSNNPFAPSFSKTQPTQHAFQQPMQHSVEQQTLGPVQDSQTQNQNNTLSLDAPSSLAPVPSIPVQKEGNPNHEKLNALLSTGGVGAGIDTFGNTGDLRIPTQRTAPGTFVNSAGHGLSRLHMNASGNNPFLNSQFTGIPQQARMIPSQTGPATWNAGAPQQQQQQQQGSLIDL